MHANSIFFQYKKSPKNNLDCPLLYKKGYILDLCRSCPILFTLIIYVHLKQLRHGSLKNFNKLFRFFLSFWYDTVERESFCMLVRESCLVGFMLVIVVTSGLIAQKFTHLCTQKLICKCTMSGTLNNMKSQNFSLVCCGFS